MKRRSVLAGSVVAGAALTGAGTVPARAESSSRSGRVLERALHSGLLGREVPYSLYLPGGYRRLRRYPVLYLLHGLGGTHTDWVQQGEAQRIVDAAIAGHRLPPLVVVMPDARRNPAAPGDSQLSTYYMNDADGSFPYADMIMKEFLPHVERTYHAGGAARWRGVGGLSMGGFGALSFALRAPGLFAAAFGLSVGHRTDAEHMALAREEYNWRYAAAFGADLSGRERLNHRYRQWNLRDAIERTDADTLARTAWYLDCGAYDQFFAGNADLHLALTRKEVDHRFMSREGAHEWSYWIDGLPSALDFLADHLDAGS